MHNNNLILYGIINMIGCDTMEAKTYDESWILFKGLLAEERRKVEREIEHETGLLRWCIDVLTKLDIDDVEFARTLLGNRTLVEQYIPELQEELDIISLFNEKNKIENKRSKEAARNCKKYLLSNGFSIDKIELNRSQNRELLSNIVSMIEGRRFSLDLLFKILDESELDDKVKRNIELYVFDKVAVNLEAEQVKKEERISRDSLIGKIDEGRKVKAVINITDPEKDEELLKAQAEEIRVRYQEFLDRNKELLDTIYFDTVDASATERKVVGEVVFDMAKETGEKALEVAINAVPDWMEEDKYFELLSFHKCQTLKKDIQDVLNGGEFDKEYLDILAEEISDLDLILNYTNGLISEETEIVEEEIKDNNVYFLLDENGKPIIPDQKICLKSYGKLITNPYPMALFDNPAKAKYLIGTNWVGTRRPKGSFFDSNGLLYFKADRDTILVFGIVPSIKEHGRMAEEAKDIIRDRHSSIEKQIELIRSKDESYKEAQLAAKKEIIAKVKESGKGSL